MDKLIFWKNVNKISIKLSVIRFQQHVWYLWIICPIMNQGIAFERSLNFSLFVLKSWIFEKNSKFWITVPEFVPTDGVLYLLNWPEYCSNIHREFLVLELETMNWCQEIWKKKRFVGWIIKWQRFWSFQALFACLFV